MGRRGACWVLESILFLGMTPADASASGDGALGCGQLSPFVNECFDGDAVDYGIHASPRFTALGFVGRIDVTLMQQIAWREAPITQTWSCEFLLLSPPEGAALPVLPTCSPQPSFDPAWLPGLLRNFPTTLRCRTFPGEPVGLAEVPPTGPWGCAVAM